MSDKRQFEYFFVRYTPHAIAEEFVNVGIVLREISTGEFAGIRFTRDWGRVLCIDPEADIEMLQAVANDIRGRLFEVSNKQRFFSKMHESFSNTFQFSANKGLLTDAPEIEIEIEVMGGIYLDKPHLKHDRIVGGRQKILEQMRVSFGKAGILEHLNKDVPISTYTSAGDPLRLDFEYVAQNEIKFLHAVSMRTNTNSALLLGIRFPEIAVAIRRKTNAHAVLTAVVDDELDHTRSDLKFALARFRENSIPVVIASEMPEHAEKIRIELRL